MSEDFEAELAQILCALRFGPPLPREVRDYNEALRRWFFGGRVGLAPQPSRPDVLEPFREAWGLRPKKPVSIRVDEWLLALVKEMARQAKTPYQEILRTWMEEGMRRALEEGAAEHGSSQPEQGRNETNSLGN